MEYNALNIQLYARWEAANRFFEDAARWASQLCNRLWVSYVDVGKTARTYLCLSQRFLPNDLLRHLDVDLR